MIFLKMSAFKTAAYISNALQTTLYLCPWEANTINPGQAAPKGSSLIWVHGVCNISIKSVQTRKLHVVEINVANGGKTVYNIH